MTRLKLLSFLLGILFPYFNFFRKRLGGFSLSFADMFNILLNDFQSFNEIDILLFFAFFWFQVGLAVKLTPIKGGGGVQRRITLSRIIVDMKEYIYMNKNRPL